MKRLSVQFLFTFLAIVAALLTSQQCKAQLGGYGNDTTNKPLTHDTTGRVRPVAGSWQTVQPDTSKTVGENDSIPITPFKKQPFQPNPKKAGLYSAIVPGLGQLYNRQYWKVPVVYVGLLVAGYYINRNLTLYESYRKAYVSRINNPDFVDQYTNIYTPTQLQQLQSDFSKYLDLAILFTGIGYATQVLDAVTSAHLKNFDISRDISMRVKPVATPYGIGIGLVMNYK